MHEIDRAIFMAISRADVNFRSAAPRLLEQFHRLDETVAAFRHSLELFGLAEERTASAWAPIDEGTRSSLGLPSADARARVMSASQQANAWARFAVMGGATAAYGLGDVIRTIQRLVRGTPELRTCCDEAALLNARQRFESDLPGLKDVRDAACHPFDLISDDEDARAHAIRKPVHIPGAISAEGGLVMHASLVDRTFHTGLRGRHVSFEMSVQTLVKLSKAGESVRQAFRGCGA